MENTVQKKKNNWEGIALIALIAIGVIFFVLVLVNIFGGINVPAAQSRTRSDLISTKEIATLSVCEFVYNGIAQTYKDNGDHDYNILYKSTVKVSIDADSIDYSVDEEKKTVTFILPDFQIENPVIDVDSIQTIPLKYDLYIDDVIKLCRSDALSEAQKSDKLLSSAKDNLCSIIEAWYSPIFEGYTFEYQFGADKGSEAK